MRSQRSPGETYTEHGAQRRALFRLAYRMLGSATDAEDVVQETFVRALAHPPPDETRPALPYLVRIAVNLSRDALRARRRRAYRGPWLPEPVPSEELLGALPAGAEARYGERESVSLAFLVALEALSPNQRAVLVLRDVLDQSVAETAHTLGLSEPNVKTLHHRARAALADYDRERVERPEGADVRVAELLRALAVHLAAGNIPALIALLARDVRASHDGGGELFAAQRVITGRRRVVRVHLRLWRLGRVRFGFRALNGTLALVADLPSPHPRVPNRSVTFATLDARGRIARLDVVVATPKLARVDFAELRAPGLRELLACLRAAVLRPGVRGLVGLVLGPRDVRRARPPSPLS